MELDFDTIAELTSGVARVSLVLFCAAFVTEALTLNIANKRRSWWPFIIAEGLHLVLLFVYFIVAWRLPGPWYLWPVYGWALVSYSWVIVTVISRWGRGRGLAVPVYITWYIWMLFAGAHIIYISGPHDSVSINWVLLGITLAAGALRIVLMLKQR